MKTRCKFKVIEVAQLDWTPQDASQPAERIKLSAMWETDPEKREDVSFSEATPNGMIEITVTNPIVLGTFKPGQFRYIDISEPIETV